MKGANLRTSVRVTFEEAVFGCEKELERYQAKDGKEYTDCMVFYYTFIRGTFRDFPFYMRQAQICTQLTPALPTR